MFEHGWHVHWCYELWDMLYGGGSVSVHQCALPDQKFKDGILGHCPSFRDTPPGTFMVAVMAVAPYIKVKKVTGYFLKQYSRQNQQDPNEQPHKR